MTRTARSSRRFRLLVSLSAIVFGWAASTVPAAADTALDGREFRSITFPVVGAVTFSDDFGACRDGCARAHMGNDLMGAKMQPLVAAVDGRVTFVRMDSSGRSGNMLTIKDAEGWSYVYIHLNNDTPGTDDDLNPRDHAIAAGITLDDRVTAGQTIGWMGDSGNAESTQPHLHFEMHRPDGSAFSPYPSLRLAQGVSTVSSVSTSGSCTFPPSVRSAAEPASTGGYWAVDDGGAVYAFGGAPYLGGLTRTPRSAPVVDLAPTPTGGGYWLVDDGGVVNAFGDAGSYGSLAGTILLAPIVDIAATATGRGYWLLAGDGGIFSFGDAVFYGSFGGVPLNAPLVALAATPSGGGYWLLGRDGDVSGFGDAQAHGSTVATQLGAPIVDIASTGSGSGYWLLSRDGEVFAYGDATSMVPHAGTVACGGHTAAAIVRTNTAHGYWMLTTDGQMIAFGDAAHSGDAKTFGARPIALTAAPA